MAEESMIRQIHRLRSMTVAELQIEWRRLYGAESRSRNRDFLWKRLAWRLQELQRGGLSPKAQQRIDELAPSAFERARTPSAAVPDDATPRPAETRQRSRDARLPVPGSVITKTYKGRELRVTVRDDGYEYDGAMYGSLTAVAKAVTGSRSINGKLFFNLVGRRR